MGRSPLQLRRIEVVVLNDATSSAIKRLLADNCYYLRLILSLRRLKSFRPLYSLTVVQSPRRNLYAPL